MEIPYFLPWFREPGVFNMNGGREFHHSLAAVSSSQLPLGEVTKGRDCVASYGPAQQVMTGRLRFWGFNGYIICQYVQTELQLQSLTIARIFWLFWCQAVGMATHLYS